MFFIQLTGLIKKELIQLLRDRNMLRMLIVMPLVQLLVLGYAINTDVKRLSLDVYDLDQSRLSRELVAALQAGDYFEPRDPGAVDGATPIWQLEEQFKQGTAEMALIIPPDFSEKLAARQKVTLGWLADGADANAARTGIGYASQIVRRFSNDLLDLAPPITVRSQFLYNPEGESVYYMVPGIVATLMTMLTLMLTAMAIVRERERGTLEQVLVTPITGLTLILGKTATFVIVAMVIMGLGLGLGLVWFKIPFEGSVLLLAALALIYSLNTLGMGMFISTITTTQQQAMFLAWFFSVFALLTSGYMTPITNMPDWMQRVTLINPMRYFMEIVRGIMMKGTGLADLMPSVVPLAIFGVIIFGFAALRFHKRVS